MALIDKSKGKRVKFLRANNLLTTKNTEFLHRGYKDSCESLCALWLKEKP